MERDKPKPVAPIGFDITDTVLLEIDTQLAKMAEASAADATEFGLDFDTALNDDHTGEKHRG